MTTSSEASTTTAVHTAVSATSTTMISTQSVSTQMALPPIPGFPWESILAGILLGIFALAFLRRRRGS
jgi:MYXO-CTERM domain-containing protein